MSSLSRRIWKWSAAFIAVLLIVLAIGVGLFRAAVLVAPDWRADAEAMAEQALGWPVRIGELDLRWAWSGPELVLTNVEVLAPETRQALGAATRIDIAFGPLDLLRRGKLRPSHVRLHRPVIALEREPDGSLFLSGYALPTRDASRVEWREVLDATLRHGRLTILDGELHYRDNERGIADWVLLLPKLSLASDGRRHEFEGAMLPPGALGEELAFVFSAEGEAARPEDWHWSLELAARDLHLEWWYQQFPWAGGGRLSGHLDIAARMTGVGLQRWSGAGETAVSRLGLLSSRPAMGAETAYYEHIAFDWKIERGDIGSALDIHALEMRHADRHFSGGALAVRHGEGDYPLQFVAKRLALDEFRTLALFLPMGPQEGLRDDNAGGNPLHELRDRLLRLAPQGLLQQLEFAVDPQARPARFRIKAEFDRLGFSQWHEMPGAHGLSGSIAGDERQGSLQLDSRDVTIDTGSLFRSALPVAHLEGRLDWRADEDGWNVSGEDLQVSNPEVQAVAQLLLEIPFDGPVMIDLAATARNADFHARSTWLPVGIMSDALVEWLDHGVLDGNAPQAQLLLRGPLKNFPFRDGSGIFEVRFRAQNVALEYAPGWPRVENIVADVRFFGPSLEIDLREATVMDALRLTGGRAHFADLGEGRLVVEAEARGDVGDGWRFLEASPLADTLAGLLGALEVSGQMQADVKLDIPLGHAEDIKVRIDAGMQGVDARLHALPWPASDLHGAITVTEREVRATRLEGQLHGNPLSIAIMPEAEGSVPGGFAATRLDIEGRSAVTEFSDYIPATWLERLDGAFAWEANVLVPANGDGIRMDVASTMEGVSSSLPQPLDIIRNAHARLHLPDGERIDADLRLDRTGVASLRFVESPTGWEFDRGRVQLGENGDVSLPQETGLQISGRAPVVDIGGWLSLDETAETAAAPLLHAFDLHAERLLIAHMVLPEQSLSGSRRGAGWEVELDGPAAAGTLYAPLARPQDPPEGRPLQLRLDRLHLPLPDHEAVEKGEDHSPDPRELPAILVDIGDFRFGPVSLGRVSGRLERTAIGYSTNELRAQGSTFDLNLAGRWEYVSGHHYTSITGNLVSRNLEDTLGQLGYQAGVSARESRADLNLAWKGSPMNPDRTALEGTVGFEIRDGSLREVRPGAGRLLGLLSITALPRRLLLDFSDFLGEGLHFDTIRGDFVITEGNAYTTNLRLRGPSVAALLVGRTGLVDRDYDQLAIVNPGVSASLPVAGYLAAGPQVGAALLLLSQLLKAPLADITQVKYRITGSWDEPVIERVIQERNGQ